MKSNKENLLLAKEILLGGRPIIFPTDTVYGIGAIPTKKAVDEIYRLKKRDKSKKIIALVSSIDKIYDIAEDIDENIFLRGTNNTTNVEKRYEWGKILSDILKEA